MVKKVVTGMCTYEIALMHSSPGRRAPREIDAFAEAGRQTFSWGSSRINAAAGWRIGQMSINPSAEGTLPSVLSLLAARQVLHSDTLRSPRKYQMSAWISATTSENLCWRAFLRELARPLEIFPAEFPQIGKGAVGRLPVRRCGVQLASEERGGKRTMFAVSDAADTVGHPPHGTGLLPSDLTDDQLAAAPALVSIDTLLIAELSEDEDEAFAAALDS